MCLLLLTCRSNDVNLYVINNDADTVRYTENIRRENDPFNVKIKELLQNYSTRMAGMVVFDKIRL